MLLMARRAAIEFHRRMLERERPALVAVALQAARLACRERLRHRRPHGSVRVMAVDALHRIFRNLVPEGHLELRFHVGVAAFAQGVHVGVLPRHKQGAVIDVHLMACRAGHRVLRVGTLNPARVSWLVQMAIQADLVGLGGRKLRRKPDKRNIAGRRMLRSRTVAGFADMSLKTISRIGIEHTVSIGVSDVVEVVLMADLALVGARVVVAESFRSDRGLLRRQGAGQEK